jgi:hypothetical protein
VPSLHYSADAPAFDSLGVGETAQETFTYTVADGAGLTDEGLVTVTVNGINDLPVAADDAASTLDNSAITISVLSNDSDLQRRTVLPIRSPTVMVVRRRRQLR